MEFDEFCQKMQEHVRQTTYRDGIHLAPKFYPMGYTPTEDEMEDLVFVRDTNLKYWDTESDTLLGDFMCLYVEPEDAFRMQIRMEMRDLHKLFEKDGWDRVDRIINQNLVRSPMGTVTNTAELMDYEKMRPHLILRPLPYGPNRYKLKNHLFRKVGDIALVLYMVLYSDEHNLNSAKVNKEQLDRWNLDPEMLLDDALANSARLAPPRLYRTPQDLENPDEKQSDFMKYGISWKLTRYTYPLLTTTRQMNGALAIFYPNVAHTLATHFGRSMYLVFTSTSVVHIHGVGHISPRLLRDTLREGNRDFPDEMLTDSVYLYDKDRKIFEIV